MELDKEILENELKIFEDKIASSFFYKNTKDETLHQKEVSDYRAVYLRLGIFSEKQISDAFKSAEKRITKVMERKK